MEGVIADADRGDAGSGVLGTLNYVAPWSARNRLYVAPGGHVTTTQYAPRTVRIVDGRPHRADFGLDTSGFTLLDHRSSVTDFGDAAELDGVYIGEATDLVRRVTGADEVVSIGWVIRRAGEDKRGAQPPAPDVHVDVHPGRADARFAAASPGGRPFRRAIMTSLWRAFSPPPQDWPLAILDYRSVADSEGQPNLLLFVDTLPDPDDVPDIPDPDAFPAGSIFTWRPEHRWWYFPDMHPGEALLFKLHDTDQSVAWRAPHTAFHDAGASGARPRESVELRTVAFFY
ncbi:MAG TPA: CmcJ/NvfI family oxidoreductase [Trebonia sp.]|nr:CmcJ/NvfI family oxidoreductase [Trebonia sp.]